MKIMKNLETIVNTIAQFIRNFPGGTIAPCTATGTDLDLDALTESGLPLRESIPVRSAEYWMEMGYPELAMEELDSLSEDASRHAC